MFQPGNSVVGYARDSGGDTQELSIQQQETAIANYCQDNGLILTRSFRDVARPGSSVIGREGFQDMMSYFRHNAPEAGLVIWSYSRFSRDCDDSMFFRADLRRRGYILHSLNDNIPEGNIGRLFEAVIDWKHSAFLEDLSRDVKRGLRDLVARYGAIPGTPPRGFIRVPVQIGARRDGQPHLVHRWEPDPDQAPRVRLAFDMLLAGSSLADIQRATGLYRSVNSFLTFFTNPLYIGRLEFGGLVVDGYCEPVVDPAAWEKAQAMIAKRAQRRHLTGDNPGHPRRSGEVYLLTGLAYCARCGSPLSGLTVSAPTPYERYICSRRKRNHNCDAPAIPRLFLDDLVTNAVKEQILTPANLAANQDLIQSTEQERLSALADQRADLRTRLASVRRRIANVTDALADQGKSRALLDKLAALEAEETGLLSTLASLETQMQTTHAPQTPEQIDAQIARLAASPDLRRLLQGLISRIVVERSDDIITLQVQYFHPPEERPPPETMSLSGAPLGAYPQRHTFTLPLTVAWQRKKRVVKK